MENTLVKLVREWKQKAEILDMIVGVMREGKPVMVENSEIRVKRKYTKHNASNYIPKKRRPNGHMPYSETERANIRYMLKQGIPIKLIAKQFGRSIQAIRTQRYLIQSNSLKAKAIVSTRTNAPNTGKPWSQDDIARLKSGLENGKNWSELAKEFGRTYDAVKTQANYQRFGCLHDYGFKSRGKKFTGDDINALTDMYGEETAAKLLTQN